jgi:hypothetical protein
MAVGWTAMPRRATVPHPGGLAGLVSQPGAERHELSGPMSLARCRHPPRWYRNGGRDRPPGSQRDWSEQASTPRNLDPREAGGSLPLPLVFVGRVSLYRVFCPYWPLRPRWQADERTGEEMTRNDQPGCRLDYAECGVSFRARAVQDYECPLDSTGIHDDGDRRRGDPAQLVDSEPMGLDSTSLCSPARGCGGQRAEANGRRRDALALTEFAIISSA